MITNEIKIRVSYADTDQMGITYYARYFEYFERGWTELLRELGVPCSEMEESGIRLPVLEAHCEYKKAVRYDQLILIKTSVRKPIGARIRMDYKVFDESGKDLLAEGYTIHPFVNHQGKAIRPPKDFVRLIQDNLSES